MACSFEFLSLYKSILSWLKPSKDEEARPDLDSISEVWLDLIRDTWFKKLESRKKYKPLRLKEIRKDLIQNHLGVDSIREAFNSIPPVMAIHNRVVSAIIGVPTK